MSSHSDSQRTKIMRRNLTPRTKLKGTQIINQFVSSEKEILILPGNDLSSNLPARLFALDHQSVNLVTYKCWATLVSCDVSSCVMLVG